MVTPRFIHIGFNFTGEPPLKALAETFNRALDWMRYSQNCWIIYSNTELETWRDRIRQTPGVLPGDSFFLSEFNSQAYTGYQYDWVWQWLHKAR
jgi:hypothetical protein